jgi:putative signal transducing protein
MAENQIPAERLRQTLAARGLTPPDMKRWMLLLMESNWYQTRPPRGAYEGDIMSEPKVIFTTNDLTEAHVIRGALEAQGIQAYILDETINRVDSSMKYALGGVRIAVGEADFGKANKFLRTRLGKKKGT